MSESAGPDGGNPDPSRRRGLTGQVAGAGVWTLGQRLVVRLIGLVSTVICARLLTPDDFGIVAMAMAIIALLEALAVLGIDSALISHPSPERSHYDSAWTLNLGVYVAISILLLALAGAATDFYDDQRVKPVMLVVAVFPLLAGLENIGVVDFRRNFEFAKEFRIGTVNKIVGFLVTVALAFVLRNYWALVMGMLASRLTQLTQSYSMSPYRPRLSVARARELFAFSVWTVANGVMVFLRQRASDFVLGRQVGAAGVGTFNVGREFGTLPTTELIMPLNRAIFPGYARIATDKERLNEAFFRVLGLMALVSLPAAVVLASIPDLVVNVMLGERWIDATPVLAIMALFGATMALQTNTFGLFLALRMPRLQFGVNAASVVVLLPLMYLGTHRYGIVGTASAFVLAGVFSLVVSYAAVRRKTGASTRNFVKALTRPLVGAVFIYASVPGVRSIAGPWFDTGVLGQAALMLLLAAAGLLVYVAVVTILWAAAGRPQEAEVEVATLIRSHLGRLTGRRF